ncbi:hypothetical protein [Rhodococcus globerulus]|uniref:hypothetical protein n=1 Tax=Rhodococcus globerulus TaxID=33008 RepID=UPI003017E89D
MTGPSLAADRNRTGPGSSAVIAGLLCGWCGDGVVDEHGGDGGGGGEGLTVFQCWVATVQLATLSGDPVREVIIDRVSAGDGGSAWLVGAVWNASIISAAKRRAARMRSCGGIVNLTGP